MKQSEFDQWVQDWIKREKEAGRKCFEVKKSGNNYYVYFQSTRYNAETKKREKEKIQWKQRTDKKRLLLVRKLFL